MPVCASGLGLRAAIDYAAAAGMSAREYEPHGKAAAEIAAVYATIRRLVDKCPLPGKPTCRLAGNTTPRLRRKPKPMANPTDLRRAILDQASRGDPKRGPAVEESAPRDTAAGSRGAAQARRAGKASVTGYFAPEVRRQLRRLAADNDTAIQALLGEALNDLFAKRGLPENVERE